MASVEFCKIPPLPWPAMASMDTNIKHWVDTVFWTSMEMESEYSMEVAVESTEFHGYTETGVVQQMHVLSYVF